MSDEATDEKTNQPSHIAQHVDRARDGTEYTHRYGAGWTNEEGDIDVKLDGLPRDGRLRLTRLDNLQRLREERKQQQENGPDIGQP